jgi:hypothetical protein
VAETAGLPSRETHLPRATRAKRLIPSTLVK